MCMYMYSYICPHVQVCVRTNTSKLANVYGHPISSTKSLTPPNILKYVCMYAHTRKVTVDEECRCCIFFFPTHARKQCQIKYLCVCVCIYIYMYVYKHKCIQMYSCIYIYIFQSMISNDPCAYLYTRIHVYIYIYIYTHTHIHTHKQVHGTDIELHVQAGTSFPIQGFPLLALCCEKRARMVNVFALHDFRRAHLLSWEGSPIWSPSLSGPAADNLRRKILAYKPYKISFSCKSGGYFGLCNKQRLINKQYLCFTTRKWANKSQRQPVW